MARGGNGAKGAGFPPAPVPVGARSVAQLAKAAAGCRACPLYKDATQTVFGVGPGPAAMMLVGEQPGDEEDRQGVPFVGPAGVLLDKLLAAAGTARDQVYVTNAVKHFKFVLAGGTGASRRRLHQKPKGLEIAACKPWLTAELTVVRPTVLLALGATAAQALFGSRVSILRDRGRPLPCSHAPLCFVTYHPSAALRAPTPADRERIRAALDQRPAPGRRGPARPPSGAARTPRLRSASGSPPPPAPLPSPLPAQTRGEGEPAEDGRGPG